MLRAVSLSIVGPVESVSAGDAGAPVVVDVRRRQKS